MSKKPAAVAASPTSSSSSSARLSAPLSTHDWEKAWKDLGALLKDKEKDDVKHAAVQALAEKIFQSSVLSGSPDTDALEVLSVSLLQQSRWSSLVTLLGSHLSLVHGQAQLSFHYAYALYRDKQHQKALDEVKKRSSSLNDAELHLQAQANYRAGNYSAAAKIYRESELRNSSSEDVELQANMLAALVSAGLLDEAKVYMNKLNILSNPPTYELAYNACCCLIESGDFVNGLAVLKKSEKLARELLEEDGLSEKEIQAELAILEVQEAFILQSLVKAPASSGAKLDGTENDRALAIYTKVLTQQPIDPNLLSIASNNIITLRKGANNIWDSLKKSSKAIDNIDLRDMTLSTRQKSTISLNRALVLFNSKQYEKARDLLMNLVKEFPQHIQQQLALTAVLIKDKSRIKEAEDSLNNWIKQNQENAGVSSESIQTAYLGLTHLAIVRGDAASAANTLVSLSKNARHGVALANRPGLVSTIVALYERANELNQAHTVIQEGVAFWKAQSVAKGKDQANALRVYQMFLSSAVEWYNRHGRESDAAGLLELLSELSTSSSSSSSASSRAESLARLVLAYKSDSEKANKFVAQLPPIQTSIDVAQLEVQPAPETKKRKVKKAAAGAASSSSSSSKAEVKDDGDDTDTDGEGVDEVTPKAASAPSASLAKSAARVASQLTKKLKKKTKVHRYPKSYDPLNPGPMPDPERWLPRWERANYKKFAKRRGANANTIRGAQGSTNMSAAAASASSTTSSSVAPKEQESASVEVTSKVSGAAAAAQRKRAGKKR